MLYTSKARNFAYTLLKGGFAWKDVANAAALTSYTTLMALHTAVEVPRLMVLL